MPVGNWLVVLVVLAVFALDIGVASPWTGLPVMLVMLGLLVAVAERTRQVLGERRAAQVDAAGWLAGVLWFEGALVAALIGFAVGRGVVLYHMFVPDSGDMAGRIAAAQTYDLVFAALAVLAGGLVVAPDRTGRVLLHMAQRPAVLLAGSFAAMIAAGSLLLTLPLSVTDFAHVSYVDSLFTMASAVCVTGLTVNEVSTTYTLFGQATILAGVQLGAIGIMTIAALALAFSRNTSLQSQLRYAAMLDVRTLADLRQIVVGIIAGTFIIEACGALALWLLLSGDPRVEGGSALWMAVFHAVSAFCSGGFSLFRGNMTAFVGDVGVQTVLMTLSVLGGLGFPVLLEVVRAGWQRVRRAVNPRAPAPQRLGVTARVVLTTSAILIVAGAALVLALEFSGALAPAGEAMTGGRVLASVFQSVNTRSSGFNTVDLSVMHDSTLLVMCVLMFIGGSPASTAGGIKTTTAAVIMATLRGELRGREPELGGRAIAAEVLRKAMAVVALSLVILLVVVLLLTLTEDAPFMHLVFEAVSAFATCGLSTGAVAAFTVPGKLIVTAAMFVGRVGPFTIALAVGENTDVQRYRLAREVLPVG
jgi:trk system potassium uptake protein TrkH